MLRIDRSDVRATCRYHLARDSSQGHTALGFLLRRLGRPAEAVASFREALRASHAAAFAHIHGRAMKHFLDRLSRASQRGRIR